MWKMILSTKAILPFLWDMAPDHPNLLPAFFEDDPRCSRLGPSFARKPLHSREGENVILVRDGKVIAANGGTYGEGCWIRQRLAEPCAFEGNHAIVGSWIIGQSAHGIGIREDKALITSNTSRFVPHFIASDPMRAVSDTLSNSP